LFILPLVNSFHHGPRAVWLNGWHQIAHTSTRQRFSRRFARRFAQLMAADCSFFRSSTAFTVCLPFCTANGSIFLLLAVVNSFHHGLHAVLLSGWQRITHSSARERLSRFARRVAQRMAADCSFFRSSMAFPTVCVPISSADGSALLVLPLVNGFHGLRAVLLKG